jgi:hypothetical protein
MPNPSLFGRNRFWLIVCPLLFLAALSRYWVYDRTESVPHDPESFRLARNIAETGQFANPFAALDTGPSAHMGPAFPAFVAFLIRVFGDGTAGMYAIKFSATLLLAVQLALFPFFSRALGMGELNGIVAACIWITAKATITGLPNHQQTPMFGWESLYAAIFLAIATCIFRRYLDSPAGSSTWLAVLVGCTMGVCLLISPSVAIVFAGFLGMLLQIDKLAVFQKPNLLLIALPAVILAPWIVRNFMVFHRFIFVRDNLGLELSISNNDCASFGIAQNIDSGCFIKVHPNVNLDEARKVLAYGEPGYNELKLQEALSWIRTHPARFSALSALRVAAFWMPPATGGPYSLRGPGRRLERFVVYCMTPLSLVGLFMLHRKDRLSAWLCGLCLSLFPLVYYVVQYEYRYRYTILWVTFLLGSLPVTSFAQRLSLSISSRMQIAQKTVASTSRACLLFTAKETKKDGTDLRSYVIGSVPL